MLKFIFDRYHTPVAVLRGWTEAKLVERHVAITEALKGFRTAVLFLALGILLDLVAICLAIIPHPTPAAQAGLLQHAAFCILYCTMMVGVLIQIASANRELGVLAIVPDSDKMLYRHMEHICNDCETAKEYWTVLRQNGRKLRQFDIDKITQITTQVAVIRSIEIGQKAA